MMAFLRRLRGWYDALPLAPGLKLILLIILVLAVVSYLGRLF